MNTSTLRFVPLVAVALAAAFVAWDIGLMAGTAQIQHRLDGHIDLLNGLNRMGSSLDKLTEAHQHDVMQSGHAWAPELATVRAFMDAQLGSHADAPGINTLRGRLAKDLAACDSLHYRVMDGRTEAGLEMADAVFGIMVQRARVHLEQAVSTVQAKGLEKETVAMSRQWNQAQWLLGLASLFAMLCVALVGYSARLLRRSHERSELLARTGEELERKNRELQETMLSKEEKEVMLKEIHHRVKNNLQIVRSLIRFQTDKVSDPRTLELFNECVNRVGAMALVHEQTYMSKDLANINVPNYLNSLVRDLVGAYNIRFKLKMDVDIQVETLGADTLTPLGLLINEVVSNSFKHAFIGREKGTIVLHISGTEEGGLLLRVGDDGVGLPDNGKWQKPNSLGMELIHTLAGQLNASMTLLPGPGMVYEMVSAPDQEVRRRA